MAYVKTTWETGDVITAEKLNNMESGIETADGQSFILHVEYDETETYLVLDKTWTEIATALGSGKRVVLANAGDAYVQQIAIMAIHEVNNYNVYFIAAGDQGAPSLVQYTTDSVDGYPQTED